MKDTFPIDINYSDLLQWLKERYLIPNDWPQRIEAIKQKKQEFLEQIHRKDSKDLIKIKEVFSLTNSDLTYDQVKKLQVMILKTEEAKQKTLLGNYSSPIITNINIVVKLYEKNNILLCEYAKLLLQYLNYDIENAEKLACTEIKNIDEISSKIADREEIIFKLVNKIKDIVNKNLNSSNNDMLNINSIINELFNIFKNKDNNLNSIDITNKLNALYKELSICLANKLTKNYIPKLNKINIEINDDSILNAVKYYTKFFNVVSGDNLNDVFPDCLKYLKQIIDRNITNENNKLNSDLYNTVEDKKNKYLNLFEKIDNFTSYLKATNFIELSYDNNEKHNLDILKSSPLLDNNFRIYLSSDINELLFFIIQRIKQISSVTEQTFVMYSTSLRTIDNDYPLDTLKIYKAKLQNLLDIMNNDNEIKLMNKIFDSEKNIINVILNLDEYFNKIIKNKEEIKSLNEKIQFSQSNLEYNKKAKEDLKKEVKNFKKTVEKTLTNLLKRKVTIIGSKNLF